MPEPFDVLAIVAVVALVVVRRFSVFPRPPGAQGGTPLRANGIAARPMGPGPRAMRTAPAWRTHPALPSPEMVKHGG